MSGAISQHTAPTAVSLAGTQEGQEAVKRFYQCGSRVITAADAKSGPATFSALFSMESIGAAVREKFKMCIDEKRPPTLDHREMEAIIHLIDIAIANIRSKAEEEKKLANEIAAQFGEATLANLERRVNSMAVFDPTMFEFLPSETVASLGFERTSQIATSQKDKKAGHK
jgi:hypothetical protein